MKRLVKILLKMDIVKQIMTKVLIFRSPTDTPYFISYMFTKTGIRISISRGFGKLYDTRKGIIRQLEKDLDGHEEMTKMVPIVGEFGKILKYELPIHEQDVGKLLVC